MKTSCRCKRSRLLAILLGLIFWSLVGSRFLLSSFYCNFVFSSWGHATLQATGRLKLKQFVFVWSLAGSLLHLVFPSSCDHASIWSLAAHLQCIVLVTCMVESGILEKSISGKVKWPWQAPGRLPLILMIVRVVACIMFVWFHCTCILSRFWCSFLIISFCYVTFYQMSCFLR